jgi:hypothetical protein
MTSHRRSFTALLVAAGLVGAVVALPGCSVIDELLYHQKSMSFDSVDQLRADGDLDAAWVPADASDIRIVESTRPEADNAAVLLTSDLALDPDLCVEVERQSAPSYSIEGAPDPYDAKTVNVFACGPWSVIPAEGGWFGWTPNHPNEQAQSPSS